ncbi:uncharacterized protein LOC123448710 isoform X2 [Hordeum vulgare subsp. vulgare]|uniref:uncharacterized protein LOC123448710 isoform X2 n=1 Tax=Hordeum vulgare subsp. vulgare TaxID=112509 RepID=UPI001D1A37C8|nr:uncharacterized protein LOC123448710 isoform X2 [Hordeum vulgare subsp. vulgare]
MCSCAPLPHPPCKPAPAPHPNLNPKLSAASAHGPTLLRCALVARAAARDDPPPAPSSFDFLALKRELEEQEEAVVSVDVTGGGGDEVVNEEDDEREPKRIGSSGRRTGRQMARRSGLLAKQVISVSSARSLGFVSQLWVDASSGTIYHHDAMPYRVICHHEFTTTRPNWVVALVEVRPSLLSGDADKFLFEDIYQVGDVVLVEDESVVENEFKLVGLHGLVGYNVVTSRRRNVGKVLWSLLSLIHLGLLLSLLVWASGAPKISKDLAIREASTTGMEGGELGLLRDKIVRGSPRAKNSIGKRGIRRMSGNCQWTIDTRAHNTSGSDLPVLRKEVLSRCSS